MSVPKQGVAKNGEPLHDSVGAVIRREGKFLLIDRAVPPFGFACVAGHIDEGELPEQALIREVEEEAGLRVTHSRLLAEEELDWNVCSRNVKHHHWYVFACETEGELRRSERETKSAGWYAPDEIRGLDLEPVWEYWLKTLRLI